jgi:AmiR/NasT family two-component response regulator
VLTEHLCEIPAAVVVQDLDCGSGHSCQQEVDHLRAALRTRPSIEQAKGILMARHGCTPEQAFEMLTQASQRSNRKLHDVAKGIVGSVQEQAHRDATG